MKTNMRLPLAIALTSAMAFAVGCSNSTDADSTAMQPTDEVPATTTPSTDAAPMDPVAPNNDAMADAAGQTDTIGNGSDQPVDDTWITTKVKSSLLADSNVAGLDIKVETVNGVVTLSGQVDQQAQIEHATRIARDIQGVTEVRTTELVSR